MAKTAQFILFVSLGLGTVAHAHQDHHRAAPVKRLNQSQEQHRRERLSRINGNYVASVKSVFVKSCFDCHSQKTRFPWYYRLPVAKQLIDSDIAESQKHLDLTGDFPFRGHGTPEEDLKAIRAVLSKGSMPPWRYRVLHPGSSPSPTDKQKVSDWLDQSERLLQGP